MRSVLMHPFRMLSVEVAQYFAEETKFLEPLKEIVADKQILQSIKEKGSRSGHH